MAESYVVHRYGPQISSTSVEHKLLDFNKSNLRFNEKDILLQKDPTRTEPGCYSNILLDSNCDPIADHALSDHVGVKVYDIDGLTVPTFIKARIDAGLENASFLVTNLSPIIDQFDQWHKELPMVDPFYAVKCNPDPVIVKLLASLGCNFDCATMGEIDLVLNGLGDDLSFSKRGIASSSIVYANPAKMVHMLDYAVKNSVRMTVFDGEDELYKIASIDGHENLQLLLRLTTDDKASICRFSKKFGCPVEESTRLLEVAKSLGLHVAGVSFHVGSGCGDADAYTTALLHARRVFDEAIRLNMPAMHIVDLGGGFPGDASGYGGVGMPSFQDLAKAIRAGIKMFSEGLPNHIASTSIHNSNATTTTDDVIPPLRFIAEPGRYFVSASTTIATKIYSRKGGNNHYQALYVDDGVYGSFNNVVYDHATPVPQRLQLIAERTATTAAAVGSVSNKKGLAMVVAAAIDVDDCVMQQQHLQEEPCSPTSIVVKVDDDVVSSSSNSIPTAVFGPTCDGLDQMCSLETTKLPRCEVGDWLLWENQGAYTHTASFVFNGYIYVPKKVYCYL